MSVTTEQIRTAIDRFQYRFVDERELQDGIDLAFRAAGFVFAREVPLTDRDRIDFLVDRVGIEVKVASPSGAVLRQLRRYAESDQIDELLLVTNRSKHQVIATPGLVSKPVTVLPVPEARL